MLKLSFIPIDVLVSKVAVAAVLTGFTLFAGRQFLTGEDALIWSSAESGYVLEQIEIEGRQQTRQQDLDTVLQVEDGMPILAIDLAQLKKRLEVLPWVQSARVERRLPSTLAITLEERSAVALWQMNGVVYLIDEAGHTIAPGNLDGFESLPFVVGKGANDEAAGLISAAKLLTELPVGVKSAVRVSERRWDIHFENGVLVKLPDDGEDILTLEASLTRLLGLHGEYQLLSREVATIDLRQPDRLVLSLTERGRRALAGKEWEA